MMDRSDLLKQIEYYQTLINQYQKYSINKKTLTTNSYNSRNFNEYTNVNQYRFVNSQPKLTVHYSSVRPKCRRAFQNKVWIRRKVVKNDSSSEEMIANVQQLDIVNEQRRQSLKNEKRYKIRNSLKLKNKWNSSLTALSRKRSKDFRAKQVPKELLPRQNKFLKVNIPCPIFRRYGKCSRNEKNRCKYVHDFKYVNVCRRFLIGACDTSQCTLSHCLTREKVPTCRFFLLNKCINDNCPYLHVKVNSDAALCPDFLNGFCKAAEKCLKKHEDPQKLISSSKQSTKVKEKLIVPEPKLVFSSNNSNNNNNNNSNNNGKSDQIQESFDPVSEKCVRYYLRENIDSVVEDSSREDNNTGEKLIPANTSIGPLSSFIPFS